MRATDVPTYVQYGGADLGITGRDTLLEHGSEGLYQPLDLRIAKCRISVAVRADFDYQSAVKQGSRLRVATKYLAIAREFFAAKGVHVDLIKLYGSMELAPLTGLADAIVDLVSTGGTLKANQLVEVEHIMDISARLVVNQAALKLKREPIRGLIEALSAAAEISPVFAITFDEPHSAPDPAFHGQETFEAEFSARCSGRASRTRRSSNGWWRSWPTCSCAGTRPYWNTAAVSTVWRRGPSTRWN